MSETPFFSDTPGPEATSEQDVAVLALLGLLRADDLPIPHDVARRLDAVLAQEQRTFTQPEVAALAAVGAASAADGSSPASSASNASDWIAPVTVLPVRRGPSMRVFTILGGVAAALVVGVVGVGVLSTGGLGGGSSSSAGSSAQPMAGADSAGAVASAEGATSTVMHSTGTAYSSTSLPEQVGALITSSRAVKAPDTVKSSSDGAYSSSNASPSEAPGFNAPAASGGGQALSLTSSTLASCVTQLTGRSDVVAVLVDHGTFEGKPADIVVVPTEGDPSTLDVWVIAPGCSATAADLYMFSRIPAP